MDEFKDIIKLKRKEKNLLLREVSALTKIDQSIISKYEKGERVPSREHVIRLAKVYNIPENDLIIAWQSDNLAYKLYQEANPEEILKVAENKIKYLKKNKK